MNRFATVIAVAAIALPLAIAADTTELADRAVAFLAALDDAEHGDVTWAFAEAERQDIHYAPINLDGLRHGDLGKAAYALGENVLAATLSARGLAKVRAIRLLERDIRENETVLFRLFGLRDPGRYFWALFGDPSTTAPWGYRYEGHHLSINVTAVPGSPPVTTPLFLGAQPRDVPNGMPSAGVAVLGEEERLARALYASLDDAQRAAATLAYRTDRGHMIGQVATLESPAPTGLARGSMSRAQRVTLDAFLDYFAGFWNEEIAAARRADIEAAREGLHFAFVAADDPAFAFYIRVSGPGLLLEIDNTEGGDHVHAVWHQPAADFGIDLLARHLEAFHGIALRR